MRLSVTYPCFRTFRGTITVALDAKTGKQIWKTLHQIPDPPKPTTKTAKGVQHYGPAGGAVWAAPTIDTRQHHALYIGTGDAYTGTSGHDDGRRDGAGYGHG